jgi:hypothetical protein
MCKPFLFFFFFSTAIPCNCLRLRPLASLILSCFIKTWIVESSPGGWEWWGVSCEVSHGGSCRTATHDSVKACVQLPLRVLPAPSAEQTGIWQVGQYL